jgi:ribosome-binding protein aMBF1 (putative translation factor)
MVRQKRKTTDALAIIDARYFHGKPHMTALLEEERVNQDIARKIYNLRTDAGLSQRQLAKLVNTTASVICRLEDADYEGHSLAMLNRIAAALNKRVKIEFVPLNKRRRSA